MSTFHKLYKSYCFMMGVYGFSRGFRVENIDSLTEKLMSATVVGTIYTIPVINILPTIRLYNRITLKESIPKIKNNLNYYDKCNFEEITGYCFHVI